MRSSLSIRKSPPKEKNTFSKKALCRAPSKPFLNLQSSQVFSFSISTNVLGEDSSVRRPEKYIKTEMNVKKGSPKSENPPKEKITFSKKALRRAPYKPFLNLQSSRAFDFTLILQTCSGKIPVSAGRRNILILE
jgi:hypothetical protein